MEHEVNILITSVGRRTRLLRYFKTELTGRGKIIAADCSALAPALYASDNHYIVPKIYDPQYISVIMDICVKEKITGVLSLIDPELSLFAKHRKEFEEIGVTAVVSSYEVCELLLDKYASYKFFSENGYRSASTYNSLIDFEAALEKEEICFPVFVKPRRGSASLFTGKAENMNELKHLYESADEMIVQEFLDGQEIGIDVYIDLLTKEVVSIFVKEKISMRAGESDKAKSIKPYQLIEEISNLVKKTDLSGPVDMDFFCVNGEYYISEINPRFGGGYPFAYECGENYPRLIINNLRGMPNKPQIGTYDENIYMMKHDDVFIAKDLTI